MPAGYTARRRPPSRRRSPRRSVVVTLSLIGRWARNRARVRSARGQRRIARERRRTGAVFAPGRRPCSKPVACTPNGGKPRPLHGAACSTGGASHELFLACASLAGTRTPGRAARRARRPVVEAVVALGMWDASRSPPCADTSEEIEYAFPFWFERRLRDSLDGMKGVFGTSCSVTRNDWYVA